jgi:hypothetical protein
MAIYLRCPTCGSHISVDEKYVGKTASCPTCSDPVRVPFQSRLHPLSVDRDSNGKPGTALEQTPMPQLIAQALKLAVRQHSLYFVAGLLLIIFLMFLSYSCLGTIFGPQRTVLPGEGDPGDSSRLLRQKL